MTRIESDRLILRPFAEADFEAYAAIHADPEVTKYLNGYPMPRWEAWRSMAMFAGHWHLRGYGQWAVELKSTGRFIGRAGLWNPEGWPGIEVGWTFGREHWGNGYATEAGRAAMQWGFESLGLKHILCVIHPENARSIRVAQRLGMTYQFDAVVNNGIKVVVYGRDR